MKTKGIIAALVFAGLTLNAGAQKIGKTKFSIGPEAGVVTGTYSSIWGFGLGASAQVEHFFKDNVSGTGIVGVISYFGKSYGSGLKYKANNIIPIRIGVRYYIGEGFHAGAQLGVGILGNGGSSSTGVSYSPQIGYNFKTNKGKAVDATFKYDGYSRKGGTVGALGIRLAYIF